MNFYGHFSVMYVFMLNDGKMEFFKNKQNQLVLGLVSTN